MLMTWGGVQLGGAMPDAWPLMWGFTGGPPPSAGADPGEAGGEPA